MAVYTVSDEDLDTSRAAAAHSFKGLGESAVRLAILSEPLWKARHMEDWFEYACRLDASMQRALFCWSELNSDLSLWQLGKIERQSRHSPIPHVVEGGRLSLDYWLANERAWYSFQRGVNSMHHAFDLAAETYEEMNCLPGKSHDAITSASGLYGESDCFDLIEHGRVAGSLIEGADKLSRLKVRRCWPELLLLLEELNNILVKFNSSYSTMQLTSQVALRRAASEWRARLRPGRRQRLHDYADSLWQRYNCTMRSVDGELPQLSLRRQEYLLIAMSKLSNALLKPERN